MKLLSKLIIIAAGTPIIVAGVLVVAVLSLGALTIVLCQRVLAALGLRSATNVVR